MVPTRVMSRCEQVVGLSHGLQVGEGGGDHLAVTQGKVHHLVTRHMVYRNRQYRLRSNPCCT